MGTIDIENMRTHVKDEPVATPNPITKQTGGEGMKQERTAADNLNSLKDAFQSVTKVATAIPTPPNLVLRGVVNPYLRRLDEGIHADANMAEKMRDDLGLDGTIGNVVATTAVAFGKGIINRTKQYFRGESNMITALNTKKYGIDPETGEYKTREEIAKQSEEQTPEPAQTVAAQEQPKKPVQKQSSQSSQPAQSLQPAKASTSEEKTVAYGSAEYEAMKQQSKKEVTEAEKLAEEYKKLADEYKKLNNEYKQEIHDKQKADEYKQRYTASAKTEPEQQPVAKESEKTEKPVSKPAKQTVAPGVLSEKQLQENLAKTKQMALANGFSEAQANAFTAQINQNYQTQVLGKDRGKTVTNDLAAIGVNVPGIAAGGNAGIQLG